MHKRERERNKLKYKKLLNLLLFMTKEDKWVMHAARMKKGEDI